MAWEPLVQAVATEKQGPRAPIRRARARGASQSGRWRMAGRAATVLGPPAASSSTQSSVCIIPPTVAPTTTPQRFRGIPRSSPLRASSPATRARRVPRRPRAAGSRRAVGENADSGTSKTGKSAASALRIVAGAAGGAPPPRRARRVASGPRPAAVMMAIPATQTPPPPDPLPPMLP